nr:serine hydroxymethyltransferase 7-like [Tanacetum cinerariifolium]
MEKNIDAKENGKIACAKLTLNRFFGEEWKGKEVGERQIADECGTVLMCNMVQISGLIATKICEQMAW